MTTLPIIKRVEVMQTRPNGAWFVAVEFNDGRIINLIPVGNLTRDEARVLSEKFVAAYNTAIHTGVITDG